MAFKPLIPIIISSNFVPLAFFDSRSGDTALIREEFIPPHKPYICKKLKCKTWSKVEFQYQMTELRKMHFFRESVI